MADVSKTIVVVLLIVTILTSVIGTWIVLNNVDNAIARVASKPKGSAQVKFTIIEPGQGMDQGEGQVKVRITNPA